jgi:hypothetical protein
MSPRFRALLVWLVGVLPAAVPAQQAPLLPGGEDGLDAVYAWCAHAADIDAVEVTWRVRRDRYSADRTTLADSTWFLETTLYRWPDSLRRRILFDESTNAREGVEVDPRDERLVEEGIAPTGEHVRRFTAIGRADIMRGPAMVDALHREAARAPPLLARWVLEIGLLDERFQAVRTNTGRVEAVAPSAGLAFSLEPVGGGWALSHVASIDPRGIEHVRFDIGDFVQVAGLPVLVGRIVTLSVRGSDGEFAPGETLELVAARPVDRPSDAAMTIDTSSDMVTETRSLAAQIAAGVEDPVAPPRNIRPTRRAPSIGTILLGAGLTLVLVGIGWRLWGRRQSVG